MFILNHAMKCWKEKLEGRKYTELDLIQMVDRFQSDRLCLCDGTVGFICSETADLLDYPMQLYTYGIGDKSFSKVLRDGDGADVKLQGDLAFAASSYRLKQGEGIFVQYSIAETEKEEKRRVQAGVLLAEPACTDRLDAGWALDLAPGYKALQLDILRDQFEISCISQGQEPPSHRLLQQGAYHPACGKFIWNRAYQHEDAEHLHEFGSCCVPVAFVQSESGHPCEILIHRGELAVGRSEGYVYFKPLVLSSFTDGCSVAMMTQGKCELQYFDEQQAQWLSYTGKKAFSNKTVRLRTWMESGSKIIKMAVVQ